MHCRCKKLCQTTLVADRTKWERSQSHRTCCLS